MASQDNMVLDDPLVSDGNTTFAAGQFSSVPAQTIPAGGFASALNMDFDAQGRLNTRRGSKSVIGNIADDLWEDASATWDGSSAVWGSSLSTSFPLDAVFYFPTYASQFVIVAQNATLYQGTENAAFAAIASSSYSGSVVYFAQLNNRLYYCDATNALKYIDSALANGTIAAGKISSIKITTQGIGYTAVPAITFSSGAGAATAVLGYGGKVIAATVTTPSSGYSAATPPTISFAAAPAGGTTAVGIANISQTPSKPKFLTSHKNRLFACSADTTIPPDTVYASDILDGESWDLVGSSIRVGGDGDPITGLYSWFDDNLLVFKQRSIWLVVTNPLVTADQWEIKLINNRIGCISHRTVQAVGADIMFLSRNGVRSISQIEAGTQTDIGLPVSTQLQDIIDNIDMTYSDYFCSAYYKNRYMVGIVTMGNTRPDTVLVYNRILQAWSGSWTGWQPRDFCITAFSGKIRLAFGSQTGRLWTWDDYTAVADETGSEYRDDTIDYESYVISRAYDHADPLVKKRGYMLQISTENQMNGDDATAYLSYDMDQSGVFASLDSSIDLEANTRQITRSRNLISLGKYRTIQFKFGTARLKVTLNSLAITGYSDPLLPETDQGEADVLYTFSGEPIVTF